MKKYIIMAVVSFLYMSSMQAMEPQQSQQFRFNNSSQDFVHICVWQVNARKIVKKLFENYLYAGDDCSFDVGAMAGKKCSLVAMISPYRLTGNTSDWKTKYYYLSGEREGNDFFVSYREGRDNLNHLFASRKARVNNVTKIFSLEQGDAAPIKIGDDMDALFSLTEK